MGSPFEIEQGIITEQLTDEEVRSFNDSVELYLCDSPEASDCIIATEINRRMWDAIWEYRDLLKTFYDEETEDDA